MKYLNVGIAFEGGNDGDVIAVIVRRILEERGFTFDYFNPETPGTAILPFVPVYTQHFLDSAVDMGIYCTDQDKSPTMRRREIIENIKATDELFLEKAAIAVPDPHIEAWLLLDDSTVKNILGIEGSVPLPFPNLSPKNRLTALYSNSDYTRSPNDLRVEIAQRMNLKVCCEKDISFNNFVQDIGRVLAAAK